MVEVEAEAKQPTIGKIMDDAMVAIERDNPTLKGVLPKDYAHPGSTSSGSANSSTDRQHRPGRQGEPLEGHPGPRLRILPLAIRQRRRQEGRPVLHAALRRPLTGRNAGALQGPRLRPVLRLWWHVRAVARSSSRNTAAGSATSRSTVRNRTTRHGGWQR